MIRLENINKYYQSGNDKIHVLKNLNYIFPDSGLVFILGPSGSGKSTLLNLLGGLDEPDTGEIYIEDRPLSSFSNKEKNNYLNSYLGFVFQEYNILKDLNLKENISLSLEIQGYSRKKINEKVNKIIEKVDLKGLEKRKVNQLSGGQKQRIAIARALVKDPKLIIADEPTGNLDSETSKKIFELLKDLSKDRLIIIVTHDEESALNYADDILRIETAKIENDNSTNSTIVGNTNEEKLTNLIDSTNKLILKRAKTPLKTINKLAFKNLWKKKFRYLLILIISAISLTFLSFAIELNGDKLYQNVYTTINNNVHYTDIYQYNNNSVVDTTDFYSKYQMSQLENGSYDYIKDITPNLTIHKYENITIDYTKYQSERENFLYRGTIDTIIRYDSTNTYKLFAGRVPENDKTEIIITDYLFESFKHFGLIDQNSQVYDILNRSFDFGFEENLKIVGIVETQYRNWLHLTNQTIYPVNYVIDEYDSVFQGFNYDYLMMNSIIVSDKAYEIINKYTPSILLRYSYISIDDFHTSSNIDLMLGNLPTNENEIVLPISKIREILGISDYKFTILTSDPKDLDDNQLAKYNDIVNDVLSRKYNLEIKFKQNAITDYPYNLFISKSYSVVGICNDDSFYLSDNGYNILISTYNKLNKLKNNPSKTYAVKNISINDYILDTNQNVKQYENEHVFAGNIPENTDDIVVPMSSLMKIFRLTDYEYELIERYQNDRNSLSYYEKKYCENVINNILSNTLRLQVSFNEVSNNDPIETSFKKIFKITGITNGDNFILGSRDYSKYSNIISDFRNDESSIKENIIVELPNDPKTALNNFTKLYNDKHHYIIDIFQYKDRIESYDVDPIIEFASTGGLIVFTILTIGIMWSIISIEIVDSKKEIGIMRSIGLTGFKVSLIFLIQMFFINFIAYGISIPTANFIINSYGSNLTDALGEIKLTMYTMTYRTPIYLAIFVTVITTFSTFLPLLKIITKKIINVISERDK